MLVKKIKDYSLLICLVLSGAIYSQYDTTHYIPYFGDLSGENTMSNLEYESSYGGAYITFSTFEPGPVNIKVYSRTSTGTAAWTNQIIPNQFIYDENIYPGQPRTWSLSGDETSKFFRYATSSSKYATSWLQSNAYGLKIVASKNIYVRVVLQPDNSTGSPSIYGSGTATHGAAFTSKGVSRGAGVEFFILKIKQKKVKIRIL
jgi:hypothetical protein